MVAQDVEDFELIVSDNASEDATDEIVKEYAASDPRIRYYRNDRNLGLSRNFNRVFGLSTGKYFKWTAHDDWHPRQTLRACTEVLEGDPSAVLTATAVAVIDEDGTLLEEWHPSVDLRAPEPHLRMHRLLWSMGKTHPLFAMMRADALRRTPISVILDPANRGRLPLRTWRLIYEHLALVARSRLAPRHKLWLSLDVVGRFGVRDGRRAAAELYHCGRILAARAARWPSSSGSRPERG
jgi:glycosyltransferase involved in cell wall biosynthesis